MDYYDKIVRGYEELHRAEQLKKLELIELHFKPAPDSLLLDIGCGSGISLEPWKCRKIGVDTSFELLKIAKQKGLFVVLARAECLPFKDKSFDVITSISAVHHFELKKALNEIERIGKEKNRIILSIPKKIKSAEEIKIKIGKQFKIANIIEEEKDIIIFIKNCW